MQSSDAFPATPVSNSPHVGSPIPSVVGGTITGRNIFVNPRFIGQAHSSGVNFSYPPPTAPNRSGWSGSTTPVGLPPTWPPMQRGAVPNSTSQVPNQGPPSFVHPPPTSRGPWHPPIHMPPPCSLPPPRGPPPYSSIPPQGFAPGGPLPSSCNPIPPCGLPMFGSMPPSPHCGPLPFTSLPPCGPPPFVPHGPPPSCQQPLGTLPSWPDSRHSGNPVSFPSSSGTNSNASTSLTRSSSANHWQNSRASGSSWDSDRDKLFPQQASNTSGGRMPPNDRWFSGPRPQGATFDLQDRGSPDNSRSRERRNHQYRVADSRRTDHKFGASDIRSKSRDNKSSREPSRSHLHGGRLVTDIKKEKLSSDNLREMSRNVNYKRKHLESDLHRKDRESCGRGRQDIGSSKKLCDARSVRDRRDSTSLRIHNSKNVVIKKESEPTDESKTSHRDDPKVSQTEPKKNKLVDLPTGIERPDGSQKDRDSTSGNKFKPTDQQPVEFTGGSDVKKEFIKSYKSGEPGVPSEGSNQQNKSKISSKDKGKETLNCEESKRDREHREIQRDDQLSSNRRSSSRNDSKSRCSHSKDDGRTSSRTESGYHSRSSRRSTTHSSGSRHGSVYSPPPPSREGSDRNRLSRSRTTQDREPSCTRSKGLDRYGRKIQIPSDRLLGSFRHPPQPRHHSPNRTGKDAGSSGEEDCETRTLREFLTTQSVKLGEKTLNACLNFDTQKPHDQAESEDSVVEDPEEEKTLWLRCSPADLYYERSPTAPETVVGTAKLAALLDRFKVELVDRAATVRSTQPLYQAPPRKEKKYPLATAIAHPSDSEDMSEVESSDDDTTEKEMERKRLHPDRLHNELWFNEPGEMNDGPSCRCSARARSCGIRHGIYPGEEALQSCNPNSNNADRLFHYRVTMSPHINFLTKLPTIISHDGHEFIFEGFSLFSHYRLAKLPTCKVIRFNIEYTIHYLEEKFPEHFTIRELELFYDYLYREILELVDLNLKAYGDTDGCKRFHFLPRFVRTLEHNGKEVLSMNEVLAYLLDSSRQLLTDQDIPELMKMKQYEWQNYADQVKGQIVTFPGKRPCSLRVDQLDRDLASSEDNIYPEIIHFGIRPLQLSYAGNPTYRKSWHEYVKFRHLLANKPKVTAMDRHKLMQRETELQDMRTKTALKRDVTVVIGSRGFFRTGIMCDMTQHALLLPVLVSHLRFHKSMDVLEDIIDYRFVNRHLLQLAMTHPSFRENFGTNPDHARNSLTNCGIRQPVYGDRRIHYVNTRKRGINTLITIMAKFGKDLESYSNIKHNERLEFLGDAVVEFHSSIHLYHLFPELEEGGLATYRAAIVQNQHLAVLAKRLQLERFMLYAHGSDLCHDLELRHAMANCFEAVMGALFIDAGVDVVDRIFSKTLFPDPVLHDVWVNYAAHPLQEQEPNGDRQWVESVPLLKKLRQFELDIGIDFTHIRLLARAFTHRSVGFNNLTLGSNQRMEFLGDTILQLIASEYLYRHFPEHHEGHLSLLRSSLVNNRTQAVVCDDLGMVEYVIYAYSNPVLKIKDKADLLEAFVGALFVDKGLDSCKTFCHVCFFPRLRMFIMNQDWNDPKSKLQQCCLTLRTMEGGEPDIPIYKVIECKGPTNTRVFTVAVYFRGQRLAKGTGHSIQRAEMAAAKKALESHEAKTWPQLKFQRKVIQKSIHMDKIMQAANQMKAKEEEAASSGPTDENKISLWVDQ